MKNSNFYLDILWVLTRKHKLPPNHWQDVLRGMKLYKIPTGPLQQINQAGCLNVTLPSSSTTNDLSQLSQVTSSSSS